jgi:glutamate dehydrogenase/leucine dehydrogenase
LHKIDEKLTQAFAAVLETKNKYNVSWRVASYIRAIQRVVEGIKKPR